MTILKNKLVKKFSTIPNEIIVDNSISEGAFRVYCYLASKPEGWEVFNADIKKQLNIRSNDKMAKIWKELITNGWITRTPQIDDKKQFIGGYDYELNDHKILPIFESTGFQKIRNPESSKFGDSEPILNTELLINKKTELTNSISRKNADNKLAREKISDNPDIQKIIDIYNERSGLKLKGTDQIRKDISTILNDYTVNDILLVIRFILQDDWYVKNQQTGLSVICRPTKFYEKLEKALVWLNQLKNFTIDGLSFGISPECFKHGDD